MLHFLVRRLLLTIPVLVEVATLVFGFNFVGDGLRDLFDPKQQQRG